MVRTRCVFVRPSRVSPLVFCLVIGLIATSPLCSSAEEPTLLLTGTVTETTTRQPLAYAYVMARLRSSSARSTVRTSRQGTYELRLVVTQSDRLFITVSLPGYQTRTLIRAVQPITEHLQVDVALSYPSPSPTPSPSPSPAPGEVFINGNASLTTTPSVILTLIPPMAQGTPIWVAFSNDGRSWSAPEPFAPTKPWELIGPNGLKRVFVKFATKTGRQLGVAVDAIRLDTTAPTAPPSLRPIGEKLIYVPSTQAVAQQTVTKRLLVRQAVSETVVNGGRQQEGDHQPTPEFIPGELLVKFKPGIFVFPAGKRIAAAPTVRATASIEALNRRFGFVRAERIFEPLQERILRQKWQDINEVYLLKFPPETEMGMLVDAYRDEPGVVFAEPNATLWILDPREVPIRRSLKPER